jgi:hypothetical protein
VQLRKSIGDSIANYMMIGTDKPAALSWSVPKKASQTR